MKRILIIIVTLSICHNSLSQTWQDTLTQLEKIMERYKPNMPGCQVAISRHGRVLFSKAYGMADLEHNVPLTTESILEAGSVSKQFTSAAMLLLEQQGKLSMDDDVRKYVPELPDYGDKITLRHMMQHTSGLKDWGAVAGIAGWPRSTKTYANSDALYIITRQKTLNHKPGEIYSYSNSNYNLFAIIVERVSGKSLAEFTKQYIFEPAGMKHTSWRDNYKRVVPNRAIAYDKQGSAYYTSMPNEYVYGNGGLLTTAEDLLLWNQYYLSGKLGNPSLLAKQLATTPFNNGRMNRYAAGLVVDSVRGWKMITHNGATAGYRANLDYFPDLGLSIAWLSNSSEFDGNNNPVETAVRNFLVKDIAPPPAPVNPSPHTVAVEKLKQYEGWYMQSMTGVGVRLYIKDGKLASNRSGNLVPVNDNSFLLGSNKVELYPDKLLIVTPAYTYTYTAVDSAGTDMNYLREYTGEYVSEEAETKLTVIVKDGKLIAHRAPGTDIPLQPTYKDGFTYPGGNVVVIRDAKKKISGLGVYTGRASNVVFVKVK